MNRENRIIRLATCACVIGGLALSLAANAQTPTLKLRYGFDDPYTGTSYTTPSDTSTGGANVNLYMFNGTGVATDYHGATNSGVAGAITHSGAMCFTNQTRSGATGPIAVTTNAALGFGQVSTFTVTMWFKQLAAWNSTDNYGGRLFVMGQNESGFNDEGSIADSMGCKYQAANQLYFSIGTAAYSLNITPPNGLPTNTWLFLAITYDGTTLNAYMGSDTSVSTLVASNVVSGQSVNFGSSGIVVIGNRANRARSLDSWIDDFRFYTGAGSAAFVENLRSTAAGSPPTVTGVYPDGLALQEGGVNNLTFTAASPASYTITNVQVLLNGADVSSSVTLTGSASSKNGSCPLQQNQIYTVLIKALDQNGSLGTYSGTIDTFSPTNFTFEAEDYDYTANGVGGQFIDNPTYTSTPQANSYFGLLGSEGIDYHEVTPQQAVSTYRYPDLPSTVGIVGELQRQLILNAQASDPNVVDHVMGYWNSGKWENYTRTYPTGKFNLYGRMAAGEAASAVISLVTSGQGTANQTTTNVGTLAATGSSYNSYLWVPLRDSVGNLAVLDFSSGGVRTVRATSGSGFNANFYMLVPVNTNLPTISNVYPDGTELNQPTNRFSFTAKSAFGINSGSIQVTLSATNPAMQFSSNVTSQLVISGSATSWNVSYSGLMSNTVYSATISVTDINGNVVTTTITFDTYSPAFVWEAEEFDYNGGQFIDNPAYTATSEANSYYGDTGTVGIDENGASGVGVSSACYRPSDLVATPITTDVTRQRFITAGVPDHIVGNTTAGQWMNYTKTFPAGTYNVYVRASVNGTSSLVLDELTAGQGTQTQGVTPLGTFSFSGAGWPIFQYVPLVDSFGNVAKVTFTGSATTLRLTLTSIANLNFFMLVPARTDMPRIDNVYPDGSMHLQKTNTFAFTASSPQAGIATNNIQLTVNGANVSASLVFSGSAASWTVSYPGLTPNTNYTAVITVKDGNGKQATTTIYFDTFSSANFTWQATDYDFNGGQFIDNPVPTSTSAANSYFGQSGSDEIDYDYATTVTGELYPYRANDYLGTQVCGDTALPAYITAQRLDATVQPYCIAWWQTNAWMNYTHTYPTGRYYVYGRFAGTTAGLGYTNEFDEVTAGVGTQNQTRLKLGDFGTIGAGPTIWQWVPLMSNSQPAVLSLSGLNTLQVTNTTGNNNADFFMLVPVPSAARVLMATTYRRAILLK